MSALRVVLIAEGSGEVRPDPLRGPLSPLHPDDWGPGHVLFARAVEATRSVPRAAIQFVEPLRTARATIAKGSSLLHRKTLRGLLNYSQPADRPDLLIVLVDGDGETARKRTLEAMISDMPGTNVIAVAINEFEAWLVGDARALTEVLGAPASKAPLQPETLEPAEAKRLLKELSAEHNDPRLARLSLAEQLDLEVVAKRCPAFAACLGEIKALTI